MRSSSVFAVLLASLVLVSLAPGQGSLTPPGAPAPTGRTLEQISPRTPVAGATSISQPGSYYLTANVTVASGNGVSISADNVTLDLNGFTISSTSSSPSGSGILIAASANQVTVRNGHILGTTVFSGGTFSGGGFVAGITALFSQNVHVADVSVSGVSSNGINLSLAADAGTIVRGCTVRTAGAIGLRANSVADSAALQIGGTVAIEAGSVANSVGTLTGAGTAILSPRIAATDGRARIPGGTTTVVIAQPGSYVLDGNLTVASGDGIRIDVDHVTLDLNGFSVSSTTASPAAGAGVLLNGSRTNIAIRNGKVRGGTTLSGSSFTNAGFEFGIVATSPPRNVLVEAVSVSNLRRGIYLTAPSGNGDEEKGDGSIIRFCNAITISDRGLRAVGVFESAATECGGIAIFARQAANVNGESLSNVGLSAGIAHNSRGRAAGGSPGIQVTSATNCNGVSNSGTGLDASQAHNCIGVSDSGTALDASTATSCFGTTQTGIGVRATIGVSCRGFAGGGGQPLDITNRYLMP